MNASSKWSSCQSVKCLWETKSWKTTHTCLFNTEMIFKQTAINAESTKSICVCAQSVSCPVQSEGRAGQTGLPCRHTCHQKLVHYEEEQTLPRLAGVTGSSNVLGRVKDTYSAKEPSQWWACKSNVSKWTDVCISIYAYIIPHFFYFYNFVLLIDTEGLHWQQRSHAHTFNRCWTHNYIKKRRDRTPQLPLCGHWAHRNKDI